MSNGAAPSAGDGAPVCSKCCLRPRVSGQPPPLRTRVGRLDRRRVASAATRDYLSAAREQAHDGVEDHCDDDEAQADHVDDEEPGSPCPS